MGRGIGFIAVWVWVIGGTLWLGPKMGYGTACVWVVGVMLGFGIVINGIQRQKLLKKAREYKPENIHGAASWADDRQLKKAGLFKKTGLPLGYSGKSGKPIYFPGTTHLITFGGTGSGKTTQALIPAALSWPESAVFL
jgi:type IV secretion system protein VirD4